jgi:leucyl/phenylalanyl-tRNA--protein transferase
MYILGNDPVFPKISETDAEGILAIGGDLSPERLINAYRNGIFPWYSEDEPIIWWSPDPRFVLFPQDLKVSKSMKQVMNTCKFEFRYNTSFEQVIKNCSIIKREGQDGTWIHPEMIGAYIQLHQKGYAVSAECWRGDHLVGGLYGIRMGKIFFGESMFAHESNASKFAFISLVRKLEAEGLSLIDCQTYTDHLASLGARMIPRLLFCKLVEEGVEEK